MQMTPKEYAQLAERFRPKLLAIAGRFGHLSGTAFEAEDLVQEALAALWRLSASGYEIRDPEALAVRITQNLCISHYRKQQRSGRRLPTSGELPGGRSASAGIEEAENRALAARLLGGLTETERRYIQMRNIEGQSLDEMAAACGRPKTSIKTTLSAARRKMLAQLKQES